MPRPGPFERHHARYDRWFVRHWAAYCSELLALRGCWPAGGRSLEIGVGTGRFAAPLGVAVGIDPAGAVLRYAARRGLTVACAVGESLPFRAAVFDGVLVVTTICFVADATLMLAEARRVLRPDGVLCIGFVDRDSPWGRYYRARQARNVFYRGAVFHAASDVDALVRDAGFHGLKWTQTLWATPETTRDVEPTRAGRGEGGFVVVRAVRD